MVDEIIPGPIQFEWDKGNINKNFNKHKVSNEEAEEVFTNEPIIEIEEGVKNNIKEKRRLVLGISDKGKLLSIIFTIRKNKIRIISARPQSRKERRKYAKEV